VGIKANLNPVPTFGALIEAVNSGEYNLVAFNSFGLDPVFLDDFYRSDGANNWTGFANTELDSLLDDARQQNDPDLRRALYARAQRIVMDEALILPIRDQVNLNASSAALTGLQFDAYGWFPLLHNVRFASQ
jgi:peptide/nickel transport system substrate-binding protein